MPEPTPPVRWRDRWLCFAIGIAVSLAAAGLPLLWDDIHLTWRGFVCIPLAAGAVVLALRLRGRRGARVLAFALGTTLPYGAIAAFLLGFPVYDEWRHERPFDAALWRENPESGDLDWPTRLAMVDDLVATHELRGMPRDGVLAMLGPDDHGTGWSEPDLLYHLGPERGLRKICSEWLALRFGAGGRVAEWAIVRE